MHKGITLTDVFGSARSIDELLIILKECQDNGIIYLLSYGYKDISIEKLIEIVKRLKNETADLEEIYRAINYQIHS
jgi:hypothetical protein